MRGKIAGYNLIKNNKGSTLVEMIVSFALLSIFLASAAVIIGLIATMYFEVKGETYANQVSDILLEKTVSEIEGALYTEGDIINNPRIDGDVNNSFGSSLSVIDKTDTSVTIKVENSRLILNYDEIRDEQNEANNRNATTWRFDSGVYNGFEITDFKLIRGDAISNHSSETSEYGITASVGDYSKNVVLILLTLNSPRYGDYKSYRFVKMYNVPESIPSETNP